MALNRARSQSVIAESLLIFAAFAFRLPILLNADGLDSDIAVVALQSRHLATGADKWLQWGTHYQGITGPFMVALFGKILPTKLTLTTALAAVTGHALLIGRIVRTQIISIT